MEIYAKGQLSYMILNCLLERDFYGLDIITEIREKSNGRIELKKPSVYSNLTRMEKQNLVSSYMQSSDLGPNRRYYSITEKGRNTYSGLKNDFERSGIDVFKDFNIESDSEDTKTEVMMDIDKEAVFSADAPNFIGNIDENIKAEDSEDDVYFDFSEQEQGENVVDKTESIEAQNTDIFNSEIEENISQMPDTEAPVASEIVGKIDVDDNQELIAEQIEQQKAVNLNEAQDYNKRLYDISKEIKHVMKKRSFAEDQISISVDENAALQQSNEKTKQSIEEVKSSLLASKGIVGNERLSENAFYKNRPLISNNQSMIHGNDYTAHGEVGVGAQQDPVDNKISDDGVFITDRAVIQQVQKPKKIEPPRLKVYTEPNINTLPAPKRDLSIDPSHKEIISRLYAKSKDSSADQQTAQVTGGLFDYVDLQDFYKANDINFKPYERGLPKVKHNTNLLYFYLSLIMFGVCAMFSGGLYAILEAFKMTSMNTDFLYILLPALVLIDTMTRFYIYKTQSSWDPKPMLTQLFMWMLTILLGLCIAGINLICGLATEGFEFFATSLILPLILLLVLMPLRYYIKRLLLIKFYK